jgi:hypothetical protein
VIRLFDIYKGLYAWDIPSYFSSILQFFVVAIPIADDMETAF